MTYWAVITNEVESVNNFDFFIKLSFILRGVAVFSFPNLSDDIYRFLWDGHLINLGENPFSHPPQYYIENHLFTERLTPELFSKLNSPNYYSVYPTVCQAVFATATFLFPKSIYGATVIIKLFLFACEVGTIVLMKKITLREFQIIQASMKWDAANYVISLIEQYGKKIVLIYALNPLIIIELIGNAHFEAAMIFFFVAAFFLLEVPIIKIVSNDSIHRQQYLLGGAVAFSLSIVSKMLPLMFLPLFLKRLGWKRSLIFWATTSILTLIFLSPLYNTLFFNNIGTSLVLYFNNFEFNASVFYGLKSIGLKIFDYDMIHQIMPFLTIFVVLFILKKSFLEGIDEQKGISKDFFNDALFVISIYFACATTVHPWYAAFPLAISVFTQWRFPVIWTFFIFLTYSGYTEGSSKHTENYTFLILEYTMVYAYFIYEWFQKKENH